MQLRTLEGCAVNLFAMIKSRFATTGYENRRRHQRFSRVTLLTIQFLDDDLSIIGQPFWGMSQDISESGIGFLSQTPITANYLRVTVVEDDYSAIAIVRHTRMFDESTSKYFVGVEFLDDYSCHDRSRC